MRSYKDVDNAPIVTAPVVRALADACLRILAHSGAWRQQETTRLCCFESSNRHGQKIDLRLHGPDMPDDIPHETIQPKDVARQIPWAGTYRLELRAPLICFDLYWKADEPLRIMQFSRGDWEEDIAALAGRASVPAQQG